VSTRHTVSVCSGEVVVSLRKVDCNGIVIEQYSSPEKIEDNEIEQKKHRNRTKRIKSMFLTIMEPMSL